MTPGPPPSHRRRFAVILVTCIGLLGLAAFAVKPSPVPPRAVTESAIATTQAPARPAQQPAGDLPSGAVDSDAAQLAGGQADPTFDRVVSAEIITTVLISRAANGAAGDDRSFGPALSLDGSRIVFATRAETLAPSTAGDYEAVVLADRVQGTLVLISVAAGGEPANAWSGGAAISGDGRFVAFYSWANNLVNGDTNGVQDLFLSSLDDGSVVRISTSSAGDQANDRSGASTTTERPAIAVDGRYIAFESQASNLVEGDANSAADVFVHDRVLQQTQRVSIAADGSEANGPSGQPSISGDGRYVVFRSLATNLAPAAGAAPGSELPAQVYLHDRETGRTELISRAADGAAGNQTSARPAISADGVSIAFESAADNLVGGDLNSSQDVFVYDRNGGSLALASVSSVGGAGNRESTWPAISADGRHVAFTSAASNLVDGDTNQAVDVFVHDRRTRHTARVSVAVTAPQTGRQSDGDAIAPPAISATGRFVAFTAEASNLAPDAGDLAPKTRDGVPQVYVHERRDARTFTLTGKVRDRNSQPVADAWVFAGPHRSVTDAAGDYAVPDLIAGTYTVRPHKPGYAFVPAQQTISLPYTPVLQDFVAFYDGAPPEPFLDLPFAYTGGDVVFLQALQDTEEGGMIDAWFDHAYPDYAKNDGITLWDGRTRDTGAYNQALGCYERRCYDGHDGVDFPYRDPEPATPDIYEPFLVYPAAPGRVVAVTAECAAGDRRCNNGYGNDVVLYHDNGYLTRYSHLDTVAVAPLSEVVPQWLTRADSLGVMGSTGNSFGMHLHFGAHRDNGNGRWDGEEVDYPVDPFGWLGEDADPWVVARQGPISRWLWLHRQRPASEAWVFGSQGATVQDATGAFVVILPPDAVDGQLRLDLSTGTRVGPPAPSQRSVGFNFWLRVLDWLQDSADGDPAALALREPATIALDVSQIEAAHLDLSRLALQRWDDLTARWVPLPTQIDPASQMALAQTDRFGNFDLQAPLLCPSDELEPDDEYFGASTLAPGSPVRRLFDGAADEDWFRLDASAGGTYVFTARSTGPELAVEMTLHDVDGLTALAAAVTTGADAAQITLQTPVDGAYFLQMRPASPITPGCGATYEVQVDAPASP